MNENQSKNEKDLQFIKNKIDESRAILERVQQIVELLKNEDPENEESITIVQNSEKLVAGYMEKIENYKDKSLNVVDFTKMEIIVNHMKAQAYPAILQGFLFYQRKNTTNSAGPQ